MLLESSKIKTLFNPSSDPKNKGKILGFSPKTEEQIKELKSKFKKKVLIVDEVDCVPKMRTGAQALD